MERLTRNGFDYCAEYCASSADCGFFKHEVPTPCGDAAIYNRLAAYEDTGLEPEEVDGIMTLAVLGLMRDVKRASAIMDAEREGRLIVLPCKVGDTVYTIIDGKIYEGEVYHISYSDYYGKATSAVWTKNDFLTSGIGAAFEGFGKTVFLTREEAEAALKQEVESDA